MKKDDILITINENVFQNSQALVTGDKANYTLRQMIEYASQMGNLDNLETSNKNSLVDAINEALSSSGGQLIYGLRRVRNPDNTQQYIQTNDFCEGWVTNKMFVSGIYKGSDDPSNNQLKDTSNWSHKIIIE